SRGRFVREPDLNFRLAVTRKFQFFGARPGVFVLQSIDHRGDRRMQLGEQLSADLFFGQRRQRRGGDRSGVLARIEVEGNDGLSLHRLAGQLGWLESPLLRRLKRGVAQQWMTIDDLRVDYLSTLVNRDLNLNRAAGPRGPGERRVWRLNFRGRAALQDSARNIGLPGITWSS